MKQTKLSSLSKETQAAVRKEISSGAATETFKPTDQMSSNAKRALEWRKKYGKGGTAVGVKRAAQLKNKDNLSLDTVKRMHSFFSRHANHRAEHYDFEDGQPTPWRVAWELWGGDAGKAWAKRIVDRVEK